MRKEALPDFAAVDGEEEPTEAPASKLTTTRRQPTPLGGELEAMMAARGRVGSDNYTGKMTKK